MIDYEKSFLFGEVSCASKKKISEKNVVSALCGTLGVGRASLPEFHAKREFDFAEKERLLNALAVV